MKSILFILLTTSLLTLTHCNNETGSSDADTADTVTEETFASPELAKAQEISGVYTGIVDFTWYPGGKDDLKISINHSGSDANKKLIVRVEEVSEEDEEAEHFCTLWWNGFFIDPKTNKVLGESTSVGKIVDADAVYSLVTTESSISMTVNDIDEDDDPFKVKELTKTDEPVLSFNELYDSCFAEAETEDSEEDEGSDDEEDNSDEDGENS